MRIFANLAITTALCALSSCNTDVQSGFPDAGTTESSAGTTSTGVSSKGSTASGSSASSSSTGAGTGSSGSTTSTTSGTSSTGGSAGSTGAGSTTTGSSPGGSTGSIEDAGPSAAFGWTFNGGETCGVAGVELVGVNVGQTSVTLPCLSWATGTAKGEVDGLATGLNNVTLTGYGYTFNATGEVTGQTALYERSSTVTIQPGANTFSFDLPQISAPQTSDLVVSSTFGGLFCTLAGVSTVSIQVTDGGAGKVTQQASCNNQDGTVAQLTGFPPGTYSLLLTATDDGGTQFFGSGEVAVNGFTSSVVESDLQPASGVPNSGVGGLGISLEFGLNSNSQRYECGDLEFGGVLFFLTDSSGNLIPNSLQTSGCSGFTELDIGGLTAPAIVALSVEALDMDGGATGYELLQQNLSVFPGETSTYSLLVTP